ncbi:hypothetical protein PTTG_27963 [Puccinia triticina 1-1 BBBD Race 1]|uniref:Retrotransposon gag domain-containing protein n=1 Tax=Puccinia triticina (isolate 1-1 / race 1 (BBBD)) TaxID=630390 RepID=A0A180GHS2_PUCT1|nr:hypothetical protein PTTG_27963 [Puccinia triticina 1-1 BBBD Race 1]
MSDNSSPLEYAPNRMTLPRGNSSAQFTQPPNVLPTPGDHATPPPYNSLPSPGPAPPNFVPRPIPFTEDTIEQNPHPVPNPHFTTPLIPIVPPSSNDHNVADLLAGLQVNEGLDHNHTILSHAQSIANLQIESRHVTRLRASVLREFREVREVTDAANLAMNARLVRLEEPVVAPPPPPAPAVQHIPEPPFFSHIYFSGDVSETYRFVSLVRDTFARLPNHFANERQRVLWISSYFRAALGRIGDSCPSYTWWRSLLARNAHVQRLDVRRASALSDYVIDELLTSEFFLNTIEDTFSNHTEVEDARRQLLALRQGSRPIGDFNIHFRTLLYGVNLSDASQMEIYEAAINPRILDLAAIRGGWNELTSLEAKMQLAVKLSVDVPCVALISQRRLAPPSVPRLEPRVATTPVKPLPPAVPMDLDAMEAAEGFSFANFRAECRKRHICIRCGENYDEEHEAIHGCPLPDDQWLKCPDILQLWRDMGGTL